MTLRLFLAALAVSSVSLVAHATTIGFSTAPGGGNFTGPVTESGYTYQTVSGSLYVNSYGDLGQDLEGQLQGGGGVVEFTSTSGDFTFSQVDFAAIGIDTVETITLTGYLDGAVVGTDTYTLSGQMPILNHPYTYTTELASDLSDVTLDELTIDLPASANSGGFAAIDNVVLNAVVAPTPEPSSLALLGTGLLGVAGALRRRLV